uniref:Homeobox domain-containing protein n=1 Tax=Panagrellus redivivus TaxID=6233 RepID=A0A7E4WB75_PANRE
MTMASPPEDHMPTTGGSNVPGTASGASSNTSTNSANSWDLIPTTAAGNGLQQNAAAAAAFSWPYGAFSQSAFPNNSTYPAADFTGPWSTSWPHTDTRFQMNKFNVPCVSSTPYGINAFNAMNAASLNSAMRSSGRRRRNLFTQDQVNKLKEAFHKETYVKPEHREALAAATGLTPQQVKIWFQNNRYKCKQKQKEDERSGGPMRRSMDPDGCNPSHHRGRSRSPSASSCNINMSGASNSPSDIKPPMHDELGIGITPIIPQHPDLSEVKGDFGYQTPDFKSLNPSNFAAMHPYSGYPMNMGLYGYNIPGMTAAMGYSNPQNTAAGYQQY